MEKLEEIDGCCPRNDEDFLPKCDRCQGRCPCSHVMARRLVKVVFWLSFLAYAGYIVAQIAVAYDYPSVTQSEVDVEQVAAPGAIVCPLEGSSFALGARLLEYHNETVCTMKRAGNDHWTETCAYRYVNFSFSTLDRDQRVCLEVVPGPVFRNSRDLLEIRYAIYVPHTADEINRMPVGGVYYGLYGEESARDAAVINLGLGGIMAVSVQPTEYHPLRGSTRRDFQITGTSGAELMFGPYGTQRYDGNATGTGIAITLFSGELALYANAMTVVQTFEEPSISVVAAMGVIAGMYGALGQAVDLLLGGTSDDDADPALVAKAAAKKKADELAAAEAERERQHKWRAAHPNGEPCPPPVAEAEAPAGWMHKLFVFESDASADRVRREDRLASMDVRAINLELAAANQHVTQLVQETPHAAPHTTPVEDAKV